MGAGRRMIGRSRPKAGRNMKLFGGLAILTISLIW